MNSDHDSPHSGDEKEILETKKHIGLNEVPNKPGRVENMKPDLSYLESEGTWDKLEIERPLAEKLIQLGYKKPSRIQYDVIRASKNQNIVAQSQNGSGKTLSFLIPAIRTAAKAAPSNSNLPAPSVIIIGNTVALIQQIAQIVKMIVSDVYLLTLDVLYRGKKELDPKTDILISTIAQIKNFFTKKQISFERVAMAVVDEADDVFHSDLDNNFFSLLVDKHFSNQDVRLLFTSATMTEKFRELIKKLQEKASIGIIEKETEELTLKNVKQYMVISASKDQKLEFLNSMMTKLNVQNVLIFDNRKDDLRYALQFLQKKGYKAELVCKSDDPKDFQNDPSSIQEKIDNFLAGKYRIMLTTNLLSRGIDMRKVTLVMNFSLPIRFVEENGQTSKKVDVETYLHRVGRTGRFGDCGIAINFVDSNAQMGMLEEIKSHYKNDVQELRLDGISSLNEELEKISQVNKETRQNIENNI